MTEEQLGEAAARAEQATKGQWETREDQDYYPGGTYIGVGPYYYRPVPGPRCTEQTPGREPNGHCWFKQDICRVEGSDDDREFLLHARDDVLQLVAEIRRLQGAIKEGG